MRRTGNSTQAKMLESFWTHDHSFLIYRHPIALLERFPHYELQWFNGIIQNGKFTFKNDDNKLETLDQVFDKEIDSVAVVAFDYQGLGCVFHRQGSKLYSSFELSLMTLQQLIECEGFVFNGVGFNGIKAPLVGLYPEFANQAFVVKGDNNWEYGGRIFKGQWTLRCAGSCTGLIVINPIGQGIFIGG